ncbi:MAG: hypothetical protein MI740_10530 [Halanaerobiales bacterium]|nr:hypothetical protein [Halanaerobiales bacterium]
MQIKILKAEDRGADYHFQVCKEDKVGTDSQKKYTREYIWPKDQDIEISKQEMKLLYEQDIAQMSSTTLPDQGSNL